MRFGIFYEHKLRWVACSRRETIHLAASLGLGALSFSFTEGYELTASGLS
jgi:hypothetical protein